jgi:hypothetical protein
MPSGHDLYRYDETLFIMQKGSSRKRFVLPAKVVVFKNNALAMDRFEQGTSEIRIMGGRRQPCLCFCLDEALRHSGGGGSR